MVRLDGDRGERWVLVQVLIFLLAAIAPRWEGPWPAPARRLGRVLGVPLLVGGSALIAAASLRLGRNLTPLPRPRPDGTLVQDGIYGVVRHPIYGGVLCLLFGGALATARLTRLAIALGALAFFQAKSRREEQWLVERYPDYAAYRRRVRRFFPSLC